MFAQIVSLLFAIALCEKARLQFGQDGVFKILQVDVILPGEM